MSLAGCRIALCLLLSAAGGFAVERESCATPFEQPFRDGAKLRLDIRPGDIEIVGSDKAVVRVACEVGDSERAKEVQITFESVGDAGRLRVSGGPHRDVRIRVQVPRNSHLIVRSAAGDLDVAGVRGNKDVSMRAGDLTIEVGDPGEYAVAEASVTAGDLHASAFGVHKGGLFRSFKRENSAGKYRLKASLWAGDIRLK